MPDQTDRPLALSKILAPSDVDQLTEELRIVDKHFTSAREQHPMRRWEYAMALRAIHQWPKTAPLWYAADVGGGGSPFSVMLRTVGCPDDVAVIDPDAPFNCSLAQYLHTPLHGYESWSPCLFQVVTCLSVLEHVDDLDQFAYHLSCLVAPGGLLFLTMDYCRYDADASWPPDIYQFHWDRKRIFNELHRIQLRRRFEQRDFQAFGGYEWEWFGPQVFDYSFASLALVKRP